jgi:plasmid stabilization system protein ParE
VPQVVYSRRALDDLERLFRFLLEEDPAAAVDASGAIQSGAEILASHPLIGRRVAPTLHELVISFGRTGYVALYRFMPALSQVRILTICHQRELDYPL